MGRSDRQQLAAQLRPQHGRTEPPVYRPMPSLPSPDRVRNNQGHPSPRHRTRHGRIHDVLPVRSSPRSPHSSKSTMRKARADSRIRSVARPGSASCALIASTRQRFACCRQTATRAATTSGWKRVSVIRPRSRRRTGHRGRRRGPHMPCRARGTNAARRIWRSPTTDRPLSPRGSLRR